MSELVTIDMDQELSELTDVELHQCLGEINRTRYKLAGVEKRVMDELDRRRDA